MPTPAKPIANLLRASRWPLFVLAAVALNLAIVIEILNDGPAPTASAVKSATANQIAALEPEPSEAQRKDSELTLQLPPTQLPALRNVPPQLPEPEPAAPNLPEAVAQTPPTRLFVDDDSESTHPNAVLLVKQAVQRLAVEIDALSAELERLNPGEQGADYAQTRLTALTSTIQRDLGSLVENELSPSERQELQTEAEQKLMPAIERFAAASGRLAPADRGDESGSQRPDEGGDAPPTIGASEGADDEEAPDPVTLHEQPQILLH